MNPFIRHSNTVWLLILLSLFLLFFLMGGYVASFFMPYETAMVAGLLTGGAGAGIGWMLISLDKQAARIERRITHAENELKAVTAVQGLTKLPLKLKDWAISAEFLERLVREIYLRQPGLVVECGSGTSTTVIAACLKDIGRGRVISLDHKEDYAGLTRRLLEIEGLEPFAEVLYCPLKSWKLDGKDWQWYDIQPQDHFGDRIDMLIVDGPPGSTQSHVRYPALPVLKPWLSDEFVIMLDDTEREEEQEVVRSWQKILDLEVERIEARFGFDLLKPGKINSV